MTKLNSHPVRTMINGLFPIGVAFKAGVALFEQIDMAIDGWFVTNFFDAGLLAQMVCNAEDSDYLEIGTAWGGSAILAALIKRRYGLKGKVVCVDPINGIDLVLEKQRSVDALYANLRIFRVENYIEFIQSKFGEELVAGRTFGSVLVDGDHSPDCVKHDWDIVRRIGSKYAMFHDYDRLHPGLMEVLDEHKGWRLVCEAGLCRIFERINNA